MRRYPDKQSRPMCKDKDKNKEMGLGDKIAQLRRQQNKTQNDLAIELQVSRIAVVNWESGKYQPTNIDAIATALHTTPDELKSYNANAHYCNLATDIESIIDKVKPRHGSTVQRRPGDDYLSMEIRKAVVAMLQPVLDYIEAIP